jgi:hypothetical protein
MDNFTDTNRKPGSQIYKFEYTFNDVKVKLDSDLILQQEIERLVFEDYDEDET